MNPSIPRIPLTALESSSVAAPPGLFLRPGVAGDYAFLDQMQRVCAGQLGFMFESALRKMLASGDVLLAVDGNDAPFGSISWRRSYGGRRDCSLCVQLSVAPAARRRRLGAALIAGWLASLDLEHSLACCWCAQDLPANRLWQAVGFVPLAFRTGSRSKQRPHLFWQRRVRICDNQTPLWFPPSTAGGAIAEERMVIPLPPGHGWDEQLPTLLPMAAGEQVTAAGLPPATARAAAARVARSIAGMKQTQPRQLATGHGVTGETRAVVTAKGIRFINPDGSIEAKKPVPIAKRPKRVNDPQTILACKHLREQWIAGQRAGLPVHHPARQLIEVGRLPIVRAALPGDA